MTQENNNGIDLWFPTAIYYAREIISEKENDKIIEEVKKLQKQIESGGESWNCNVYTTFEKYNLHKNKTFEPLFSAIDKHVKIYAEAHGSDGTYECGNAWFNVNKSDSFQEYHTHNNSIISAIYYIQAPEGSGSTVFKDPKPTDMLPLKNIMTDRNDLTYEATNYSAETGKLLLFRSFVPHLVQQGTNTIDRITLSANYA